MTLQVHGLDQFQGYDWRVSPTARAIARAFTPPPDMEIWQWADTKPVMIQNEDAPEPGPYRSAKTPYTRRLQELMRNPFMWVWNYTKAQWQRVPVNRLSVQKSSQSGFSEACLNGIRWRATFRPCNVIYAMDSAEEAAKIAKRLLRSLKLLDPGIFTGDPNDVKSLEFKLRGMMAWFYGSGAEGKFANKQAPLRVNDEFEEHQSTLTGENLASRGKGSDQGGLQIDLSKPKFKGGPINVAFEAGNQEEYFVPCPHCRMMQPLTFFSKELDVPWSHEFDEIKDEQSGQVLATLPRPLLLGESRKFKTGRIVFDHCRNLLGRWDLLRILSETYYECANPACVADETTRGRIYEETMAGMIARGLWLPMVLDGTPGIVSQHFTDLLSEDNSVDWGRLVLKWLDLKKQGTEGMRTFYNHYLGEVWSEVAGVTSANDITANIAGKTLFFVDTANTDGRPVRNVFVDEASALRLAGLNKARGIETPVIRSACPPYKRGTIPFECYRRGGQGPETLILGSDIGETYAKWAVVAVHKNIRDVAVVDWGTELDPQNILELCQKRIWKRSDGTPVRVIVAFMDRRWRSKDVWAVAKASRGLLIPIVGIGGASAQVVKLWHYHHVTGYGNLKELSFNKQRSLDAFYKDRIQRKRARTWFPIDVEEDPQFVEELCGEEQEEDKRGRMVWKDPSPRPNHYGDCVSAATTGLDYLTRELFGDVEAAQEEKGHPSDEEIRARVRKLTTPTSQNVSI